MNEEPLCSTEELDFTMNSEDTCFICCKEISDSSFSLENANTLCRILKLESYSSTERKKLTFSQLLRTTTYCSKCTNIIEDFGQTFGQLDALQKKLEEGGENVEEELRHSQGLDTGQNERSKYEDDKKTEPTYNQDVREQVLAYLDEKKKSISTVIGQVPAMNKLSQNKISRRKQPSKKIGRTIGIGIPVKHERTDEEQVFSKDDLTPTFIPFDPQIPSNYMYSRKEEAVVETLPFSPSPSFVSLENLEDFILPGSPPPENIEVSKYRTKIVEPLRRSTRLVKSKCVKPANKLDQSIGELYSNPCIVSRINNSSEYERNSETNGESESDIPGVIIMKIKEEGNDETNLLFNTPHPVEHERMCGTIKKQQCLTKIKQKYTTNVLKVVPRIGCPRKGCRVTFRVNVNQEFMLQAHIRKIHEGIANAYICDVCNQSFSTYWQFNKHRSGHITSIKCSNTESFTCGHCQEVCRSTDHLKLHIIIEHKPELIRFRCEYCNRPFLKKEGLKLHLLRHTKKREYLCEFCSKPFKTFTNLRYHKSKHHYKEKDVPYEPIQCKVCSKVFAAPSSLRNHIMKQHEGRFKHKCQLCEYGAMTPSGLQIHMRNTHSEDRPFKCDQCLVAYKHKSRLNVHMRTHTGERPFKCNTCAKCFIDTSNLRRHELIHSKEQCHVCEVCGKTFPLHNYLYVHMKSHKHLKRPKQIRKKKKTTAASTAGESGGD